MRGDIPTVEHREFSITRSAVNEKSRTVELSFSSELPYERWWGTEVLDHSPGAMRTTRLSDGAALLINHSPDSVIGVVESAKVGADRKGRAVVRFGTGTLASEVFQDVIDGIRSLVSVGYRIHNMVLESTDNGVDTYKVVDWEPYEISLVAVPADPSVGVGRSHSNYLENKMENSELNAPLSRSARRDSRDGIAEAVSAEQYRIAEINNFGKVWKKEGLAEKAISENWPLADFRAKLLAELNATPVARLAENPAWGGSSGRSGELGLSNRDIAGFRFTRLIRHMLDPNDRGAREAASFELECSDALRSRAQAPRHGTISVPSDVTTAPFAGLKRDLVAGTTTAGGHTVATDVLGASLVDLLVGAMLTVQLGATVLRDLVGNAAIPRQTASSTAYWLAENANITESQQAFDQVTLSPKTVGAFTDYSRQLLLQSSIDIEGFIRMDISRALALAIDLAAINGSGASNQPRGIMQTAGIGSVAGGANGLAPTWDHVVQLESAIANPNAAVGRTAYLTNSKVRGKLRTTQRFSGTDGMSVWPDALDSAGFSVVAGHPAGVSNQVPSNLTKGTSSGVCSAILFGNWQDLLIGMWGGLDLLVDPYTGGLAGTRRVIAMQSVDVSVRHPESFAAMLDALTI